MHFISSDSLSLEEALVRTTHLAIAAHPDDLELMAHHAILQCLEKKNLYFTGIVVTSGNDPDLIDTREQEQILASKIGKYNLIIFLRLKKDAIDKDAINLLIDLITRSSAKYTYVHNPFDHHPTHQKISILSLIALKRSPPVSFIYACEVWGSLEWSKDRVEMDLGNSTKLLRDLLSPYKSQLANKKYDDALIFRLKSNTTFNDPYSPDRNNLISYYLDLTSIYSDDILTALKKILSNFYDHKLQNIVDNLSHLS